MMIEFDYRKFIRAAVFSAAILVGVQGSAALAQQSEAASIMSRIRFLSQYNPGSALAYAVCASVARSNFEDTQSIGSALTSLAVCEATGCMLTESYNNCLAVGAELFILHMRYENLN